MPKCVDCMLLKRTLVNEKNINIPIFSELVKLRTRIKKYGEVIVVYCVNSGKVYIESENRIYKKRINNLKSCKNFDNANE